MLTGAGRQGKGEAKFVVEEKNLAKGVREKVLHIYTMWCNIINRYSFTGGGRNGIERLFPVLYNNNS